MPRTAGKQLDPRRIKKRRGRGEKERPKEDGCHCVGQPPECPCYGLPCRRGSVIKPGDRCLVLVIEYRIRICAQTPSPDRPVCLQQHIALPGLSRATPMRHIVQDKMPAREIWIESLASDPADPSTHAQQ